MGMCMQRGTNKKIKILRKKNTRDQGIDKWTQRKGMERMIVLSSLKAEGMGREANNRCVQESQIQ